MTFSELEETKEHANMTPKMYEEACQLRPKKYPIQVKWVVDPPNWLSENGFDDYPEEGCLWLWGKVGGH